MSCTQAEAKSLVLVSDLQNKNSHGSNAVFIRLNKLLHWRAIDLNGQIARAAFERITSDHAGRIQRQKKLIRKTHG